MVPPAFADAAHPTAPELRRRAIWSNWRGIADLAPGGGYGPLYGTTQAVPGREFAALVKVEGASQPHRVLVQVPDAFDTARRCVVVAPASGSRGVDRSEERRVGEGVVCTGRLRGWPGK